MIFNFENFGQKRSMAELMRFKPTILDKIFGPYFLLSLKMVVGVFSKLVENTTNFDLVSFD